jgi:hypothetical protein
LKTVKFFAYYKKLRSLKDPEGSTTKITKNLLVKNLSPGRFGDAGAFDNDPVFFKIVKKLL